MVTTQRRPLALTGSGMVFFNNLYIGHCTTFDMRYTQAEAVGRYKGHAIEVSPSTRDMMIATHMDDFRPEAARIWLNKLANSYASLTSAPALTQTTETEYHLEPVVLGASGTASTLSAAGALAATTNVWKRDFSQLYVKATDYTQTTSQITRIGAGSITSGEEVLVSYDGTASNAIALLLGKGNGFLRSSLKVSFVESSSGYPIWFETTYASPVGDLSLVINHASDWAGIDVQWRVLADLTATNPYGKLVCGTSAIKAVGN
jgi:hypothetical protein